MFILWSQSFEVTVENRSQHNIQHEGSKRVRIALLPLITWALSRRSAETYCALPNLRASPRILDLTMWITNEPTFTN